MIRVAEIWVYPVKSMVGGRVEHADLNVLGIIGDRGWATRDEERGGIRGAKKIGQLMQFSARYTGDLGGEVEITCPDGTRLLTSQADVDDRLSAALDHQVTLWPLQPADDLDHYRRGASDLPDDPLGELRNLFGREADEPLPDLSVLPPVIMEFESPPGTYYDAYPLTIMSTSAFDSMRAALPDANIDVRRFRPSVIVDTGDQPGHPEFDWKGRRARLGTAEIQILDGCPRCVMVTRRIDDDVPQDRTVLRHIVRDLGQDVAVYASIITPGTLRVGDALELL